MPDWNELFRSPENRWKGTYPAVASFIEKYMQTGHCLTLDLGSGAGRHLVPLQVNDNRVVGMDFAGNGLEYSRIQLLEKHLPAWLVQADMSFPLPFAGETFDHLVSIHVIFHNPLSKISATLNEIYRVLKPGGMALITFNSVYSYRFGKGTELEPGTWIPDEGVDQGIVHHFSSFADLASLLEKFKIIRVELDERNSQGQLSSHWVVTAQKPF